MINSAEEFLILRESNDKQEQHTATNDEAPTAVWLEVINKYPHMKEWVIHNKTIPLEILQILITDEDSNIRCCIARKNKLTDSMFHILATDVDDVVRNTLSYNKNIPIDVLVTLSKDTVKFVQENAYLRLLERSKTSKKVNYTKLFWGENSFHHTLNEGVCDIQKYWELECQLIILSKKLSKQQSINKKLARDICFLGIAINNLVNYSINELDIFTIDTSHCSEDEISHCLDRFNHLMRILWEAGNYKHEESYHFFSQNPQYC